MFYAWIASIIYGVNAITGKLTIRHRVANPWLFHFVWEFFILIGILPIALTYHAPMPVAWGSIALAGFFAFLVGTLYILALNQLDVSVIGPLYNFRSVFTALLGAAFLSEVLTGGQYLLIGIIFTAGIFLNIDEHFRLKAFFRKQSMLGMLAVFTSAIFGFTIKNSIAANGFWTTSLWMALIATIFSLSTLPLFYKDLRKTPIRNYSGAIITGLLSAFGDLAANKAFSANVTISSAIISIPFSMIFAFLFSTFAPALLEKHTIRIYAVRFVAAGIMILAAIKLS
ncbi:MAG: EamA family transporter [Patescibacteria group bacterium]